MALVHLINQIALTPFFLIVGLMKIIFARSQLKNKVGKWVEDFSIVQIKSIGILETLSAIGLLAPMVLNEFSQTLTLVPSYLVLIIIMIGATWTHWKRGESFVHSLIILFVLLFQIFYLIVT